MDHALKYTPISTAYRDRVVEASGEQRGNALALCLYCAARRNGGVIHGCKSWERDQWIRLCGVSDVPETCGLYRWEGDDLRVLLYAADAERKATAAYNRAQYASRKRWSGKACNAAKTASNVKRPAAVKEVPSAEDGQPIEAPEAGVETKSEPATNYLRADQLAGLFGHTA